ncbi:calcineurin-like phosphoesterase family protein [uncultured Muribaculum sp.]|uniref:calcineurin-like phosphoesterase family protein n=4 Tax=uncultured Muribaculum sp. TaxID=1918613 RepID=UPI0025AF6C2F|nr:calcineurin-like phosphoesterase family protein [uncultured Muribaculum sp.]
MIKSALTAVILGMALSANAETKIEGRVYTTEGHPLKAVAVSDGYNIVMTDSKGRYSITSASDMGYVFVSTPNGYEPATFIGNRPKFWQHIKPGQNTDADFVLRKIPASSGLTVIAVADPQIANRCGDIDRLRNLYVPDINQTIDSVRKTNHDPIVITLGDIICDFFVAAGNGYTLDKFNNDFQVNAPVYHTMGNHDNDPFIAGDIAGSSTWHKVNGPSYYSFNRGGAHFISVDNIVYVNDGASNGKPGNRHSRTAITDSQLEWIARDLATVKDKDAPLFIMMHGIFLSYPVAEEQKVKNIIRIKDGGAQLDSLLQDFTNVKVLSGHAHNNHFQHTPDGRIREYNYAATCGTWWPAKFPPYGPNTWMCLDGTPWGYGIWNFSQPAKLSHVYKGYNFPTSYQMRVYDLNHITISDTTLTKEYLPYQVKNQNVVLANIWAYEPGCSVRMYENGQELKVQRIAARDPLHFLLNAIPVKAERGTIHKGLMPEKTAHMFRATASGADTPVTVVFKDLYGNTFTTTIERPGQPYINR